MKTVINQALTVVYESYPRAVGRAEVATKLNANYNTVCGALVKLAKRGVVENVQPGYYKYVKPEARPPA